MTSLVRERTTGHHRDLGNGLMVRRVLPSAQQRAVGLTADRETDIVLLGGPPLDAPRSIGRNYVAATNARIA